ncbi:MAG: hypothetical protein HOP19_16195 [Acidobacteria bacterium]|nr:hypothetical protein [Acidobacteriota bacterium]
MKEFFCKRVSVAALLCGLLMSGFISVNASSRLTTTLSRGERSEIVKLKGMSQREKRARKSTQDKNLAVSSRATGKSASAQDFGCPIRCRDGSCVGGQDDCHDVMDDALVPALIAARQAAAAAEATVKNP